MKLRLNDQRNSIFDAVLAEKMILARANPPPPEWDRVNSLFNPLGAPAYGWFMVRRKILDKIGVNATCTLKIEDDEGRSLTANNLVIAKEPDVILPGKDGDENSIYMVQLGDQRHLLADPFLGVTINKQYNVRAPAWGGVYYDDTRNSGSDWTWSTMIQDIWQTCAVLGTFPSLPFTPHGTPEGWKFPGLGAWDALCQVLWRIGCAVKWNPEAISDQYTIVRVGSDDAASDKVLSEAIKAKRLIYDRYYMTSSKGRVPKKTRILFHRQEEHYGTEQTTPKSSDQWSTSSVHEETVTGANTTDSDANTIHTIWDDLPALYDVSGNITNQVDLTARAQERSDDFYRMLQYGGGRMLKTFSGILAIQPGSKIKGVSWGQDMTGIG